MGKISIIVPVFNGERYIRHCLDSLISQSFGNIEIILVNDGSTDNTEDICSMYEAGDSRVLYIRKENGGVSSARNCGLENASGEYVMFVDSDDVLQEGAIETIQNEIVNDNPDILRFGFMRISDNGPNYSRCPLEETYDGEGWLYIEKNLMLGQSPPRSVWTGVYKRRNIVDFKLLFDESLTWGEDFDFNIRYLSTCRKIKSISDVLYAYHVNDQSTTSTIKGMHVQSELKLAVRWFGELQNRKDLSLTRSFFANYFCNAVSLINKLSSIEKLDIIQYIWENKAIFNHATGIKYKVATSVWKSLGLDYGTRLTGRILGIMEKSKSYSGNPRTLR